jgi:hypothetical protein
VTKLSQDGRAHAALIAVAVIGFVGTVLAAIIGILPSLLGGRSDPGNSNIPSRPAAASIFLSETSSPAGQRVNVSGDGFLPNDTIKIRVHTFEVASTQVNETGAFKNVSIEIPTELSRFAPLRVDVIATGSGGGVATKQITVSG